MKIILVAVTSLDGKTTRWKDADIYKWTSAEDKKHFFNLVEKSSLIIMGRLTYEAAKDLIKLSPKILRVVVTSEPDKYKNEEVSGQLEFHGENLEVLIANLEKKGFKEALLVGGEALTKEFLKSKLINEIWLTLEPLLFGSGKGLISEEEFNIGLDLQSIERLNEKGTLLLKYKVNN